jgi:hypothetical protein
MIFRPVRLSLDDSVSRHFGCREGNLNLRPIACIPVIRSMALPGDYAVASGRLSVRIGVIFTSGPRSVATPRHRDFTAALNRPTIRRPDVPRATRRPVLCAATSDMPGSALPPRLDELAAKSPRTLG